LFERRAVFATKRRDVTAEWRKWHNEELIMFALATTELIKSRKGRWAEHKARMR
jgi:hypothetical protein